MKRQDRNKPTFWVTNITGQDVSLEDLGVRVRAFTSINLLDAKHYPYVSVKMLEISEQSGSLFNKSAKVVHRKVPPYTKKTPQIIIDQNAYLPTRQHSIVEINEEKYAELDIVNEDEIISNISNPPLPNEKNNDKH